MNCRNYYICISLSLVAIFQCQAQKANSPEKYPSERNPDKFKQLYDFLATPNMYRTASGAPGPEYYQQQADYKIAITLDETHSRLMGEETITYTNNARESLDYMWVQLDQNLYAKDSQTPLSDGNTTDPAMGAQAFSRRYLEEQFKGGFEIDWVKDAQGNPMTYTINKTMMRVELPQLLAKGQKCTLKIKWSYNIVNYLLDGGRSGYEHFDKDGNNLYILAQFYPRMAVYNDVEGWQNQQFWGAGEFALPFGNFDVSITVPADHVMEATGTLLNRAEVFTADQLKRYELAEKSFEKPVIVCTQAEAEQREKSKSSATKTWHFKADNVRDFGIATSRKFIYDAMAVQLNGKQAMAISVYPKEGNPLWGELSTRLVAHTLKIYSQYTFDYPYPKAVSVHAQDQGMEYPMICWNWGRPDADGKYTDRVKEGMMSVIIHEVGHNYFPMIVNSDERQWTWMDEGLNSFLEFLTLKAWDPKFPTRRGPAKNIVAYMKGDQKNLEPIMTNSESIRQFGNNAYGKPATALNILRETVMGHELFDYAFKTYANRWKFKHPTPEDFFRTMEDASAVDLDWFWRGWFYTTDVCDIGIKEVKKYFVSNEPSKEVADFMSKQRRRNADPGPMVYMIAEGSESFKPELNKAFKIADVKPLQEYINNHFSAEEQGKLKQPAYFYQITFDKPGGLVMPILVELTFEDGSTEMHRFPAQIWRKNDLEVSRTFATQKALVKITVDPNQETADVDTQNNQWPSVPTKSKFDE
ncbi:MAG: aminopeptidase [Flavobacterium sp. BFFFF2]|nr:MAG: aminopeptidase [Flavobacterium sp. BFFFF2]